MIKDTHDTLRKLLYAQLKNIDNCHIEGDDQITFLSPAELAKTDNDKANGDNKPRVNLALCHVQENVLLRAETLQRKSSPQNQFVHLSRPPARFDLSYLITATGAKDTDEQKGTDEHELLSHALGVLMRAPYVEAEYLAGDLQLFGTNAMLLSVAQPDHLLMADPGKLWQSLGAAPRPALSLVATVMFNPYVSKWTPVVLEAIMGIGQGTGPDGVQHPLDRSTLRVSIAGIVVDSVNDRPIEGAVLTLPGRGETATSDHRGFFYLLNLPDDTYQAHIRHPRYKEHVQPTTVPPPGQPDKLKLMEVKLEASTNEDMTQALLIRDTQQRNARGMQEKGRKSTVTLAGRLYFKRTKEQEAQAQAAQRGPLAAANIVVRCGDSRTTTNSEGIYCFFDLNPDAREIVAEVPGLGDETVWIWPPDFKGNVAPVHTLTALPALEEVESQKEKNREAGESPEGSPEAGENAETASAVKQPDKKTRTAKN